MDDPKPSQPASDRGNALIAAAILGAALILSWGLSGGGPRYQLAASGDSVVRMDNDSGEMIACRQERCVRVEPPDREKVFGPLTVRVGSKEKEALPPANESTPLPKP